MGKKSIDVGGSVEEINASAALIANAAKKLDAHPRIPEPGKSNSSRSRQTATPEPKQAADFEVVGGTNRRDSKPDTEMQSGSSRIPRDNARPADDPWVTGTVKMRNSKKKLLKELSLTRELKGLTPHQQKDLVDEALDYILEKYRGA